MYLVGFSKLYFLERKVVARSARKIMVPVSFFYHIFSLDVCAIYFHLWVSL